MFVSVLGGARPRRRRAADGAGRPRQARRSSSASPRSTSAGAAHELKVTRQRRARGLPRARQGAGEGRRAHRRRHAAAAGQRGRARRRRRGPARARAQRELEPARRDDGPARLRRAHGDGADAGGRQAPLRPARRCRRAAAAAAAPRASCSTRCCSGRRACRSMRTGSATVEVPLNDSLTSFRIVAVADRRRRTASAPARPTIRSTQDLMLLPGLAAAGARGRPLPRRVHRAQHDGARDRLTRRRRRLEPATPPASATALRGPHDASLARARRRARSSSWPTSTVPAGADDAAAHRRPCTATAEGAPADTAAGRAAGASRRAGADAAGDARCSSTRTACTLPVQRPADALPGRGGVDVACAPTLVAGLDGVREYMRRYPYRCLEQQRVARGRRSRDAALLARRSPRALPSYLDATASLKYFPTMPEGSDVLTRTCCRSRPPPARASRSVREKMVAALRRFVAGSLTRESPLRAADLAIRKLAAIEALARVGAVEPALLGSIAIEPDLWPTSAVLDWWSILQRVAERPERDERLREAAADPARAAQLLQGTTMGFSTERRDSLVADGDRRRERRSRCVLALLEHGAWRDDAAAPRARRARPAAARRLGDDGRQRVGRARDRARSRRRSRATPVTRARRRRRSAEHARSSTGGDAGGRDRRRCRGRPGSGDLAVAAAAAPARRGRRSSRAPRSRSRRRSPRLPHHQDRDAGRGEGRRQQTSRGDVLRVRLEIEAQIAT